MSERERRLPIKVVIPQEADLRSPHRGGSHRKVFRDSVDRDLLLGQVAQVRRHFAAALSRHPNLPAVARVVLREDALAKSHRPQRLFGQDTCPIIGGETFGHLLVSVSAGGLDRLERDIDRNHSDIVRADLSTVNRIEPYTAEDAAGYLGVAGLCEAVGDHRGEGIKFRLFEHRNESMNHAIHEAFLEMVHRLKLPSPELLPYISGLRIYRVRDVTRRMVSRLAGFVGTQSVEIFPQFELFSQYILQGDATATRFPGPDPRRQYPVVGLIDSGTDPGNPFLQAWIVNRDEEDVPPADQDNNHGSFVAGLIINGRRLNHNDNRFPASQSKIVDVVGMPKPGTSVTEADLLHTIRRVIRKYPDVKVWNLSVSRKDMVCQDNGFSDFGMELDAIQRRHDVTFVVCAGNYESQPLRGWPPDDLGENDRLHPPADSALGITVGAMAHVDRADTRVRREEPSPFTRRGPGAAFLPKPEVCHYGGNCSGDLNCHQVGIVSLDGTRHIAEAIGTSFSTPLVSSLLANVRAGIVEPISRNLAKALLVQSAALRGQPIVPAHLRYTGFGIPNEVEEILTCAPWQATMILEPEIDPRRRIFARADFPIPNCFRLPDGRIEGNFLLTLVYDPPLDPAAGAEYCQVNVDVSLGTYDVGKEGKPEHKGVIPLDPSPADLSKLYERNLVEYGFKWSPVKVYRKRLERTSGQRWQVQMRLLHRAGLAVAGPQRVALIVTLFDPAHTKPVYNDVITAMARSGWVTQDLRVDERIRARSRG